MSKNKSKSSSAAFGVATAIDIEQLPVKWFSEHDLSAIAKFICSHSLSPDNATKLIAKWVANNADIAQAREIEIAAQSRRKTLQAQARKDGEMTMTKSLIVKEVRNNTYFYEQWWEGGKARRNYLGRSLPPDYNQSSVKITPKALEALQALQAG